MDGINVFEPSILEKSNYIEPLWTDDVIDQLNAIEYNSTQMGEMCRLHYLELVKQSKWFRLPIIFFSGANSIFSVSLSSYMSQSSTSLTTCLISFLVSLISSVELYLGLVKRLELSLTCYKSFYLLSIKIQNTLRIDKNKTDDPIAFLTEVLTEYEELFKQSEVYDNNYLDKLITLSPIRTK